MVRLFSLPLVVMHYDLVGDSDARSAHEELTQERLKEEGIQRLTKSVLAIPQEKSEAATLAATRLWQSVAKLTRGNLVPKDRFYLHYPQGSLIATVVEVIGPEADSLSDDPGLEKLRGATAR